MIALVARIGLSVLLLFAVALPAEAQIRRLRPQERLNPVHERSKIEAQQAYQQGKYQKAIDLTSSVLRSNPRDDVAYYLRASARVELGLQQRDPQQVRNGIADSREAIRINGRENPIYYIPYLYGMTGLAALEGRNEHAEVAEKYAGLAMDQAGDRPQDRAHLLYQRGRARAYLQKFDEAISDFKQALRLVPDQLGFHLELADAYARSGRIDEAAAAFDQAVKQFPDQPVVYNNRGMFRQRQGQTTEAVSDYTRAISLNPRYVFAYTNRGFALLESGDAAAAENDFTESLRIDPKQPSVLGMRATARLEQGKTEQAIADHRQAVKLAPDNPVAHADLGYALFFVGRYAEALQEFDRAVELDQSRQYLNPWRYLAMARAGQAEEAREKFVPLIEADESKRNWIDHLLTFLSGQIDAERLMKSVNRSKPEIESAQLCEAHFFIGQKLQMAGDLDAAADHFEQAVDTGAKQLAAYRGARLALKKTGPAGGTAPNR